MNNLKAKCPKCKFEYVIPLQKELVRTIPMNKLYWGWYLRILSQELGYLVSEELHEELKLLLLPRDSLLQPGKKVGGSTTKLTRREFSDYLERIQAWALQFHNINLPDPEDKK